MAQQTINNGESGLSVRTKLNDNFTELYSAIIFPTFLLNQSADTIDSINEGDYVDKIFLKVLSGTPTVKIGSSFGGDEFMPNTILSAEYNPPIKIEQVYSTNGNVYFDISGGNIDIRIDKIANCI